MIGEPFLREETPMGEAQEAAWHELRMAARAQISADIDALVATELAFGDHVSWVEKLYALTDRIEPIHRVGFPRGNDPYTTCNIPIPHPLLWFPLSPALIRTMEPCRFCEAEYHRTGGNNVAAA